MKRTVVITDERIGRGPDELGTKLMGSFLRKLCSERRKPEAMVFYGTGVRLLAKGSGVLDALDILARVGVDIIACGTCVTYYELKDEIAVGRVGDMPQIIATLMASDSVVTI